MFCKTHEPQNKVFRYTICPHECESGVVGTKKGSGRKTHTRNNMRIIRVQPRSTRYLRARNEFAITYIAILVGTYIVSIRKDNNYITTTRSVRRCGLWTTSPCRIKILLYYAGERVRWQVDLSRNRGLCYYCPRLFTYPLQRQCSRR